MQKYLNIFLVVLLLVCSSVQTAFATSRCFARGDRLDPRLNGTNEMPDIMHVVTELFIIAKQHGIVTNVKVNENMLLSALSGIEVQNPAGQTLIRSTRNTASKVLERIGFLAGFREVILRQYQSDFNESNLGYEVKIEDGKLILKKNQDSSENIPENLEVNDAFEKIMSEAEEIMAGERRNAPELEDPILRNANRYISSEHLLLAVMSEHSVIRQALLDHLVLPTELTSRQQRQVNRNESRGESPRQGIEYTEGQIETARNKIRLEIQNVRGEDGRRGTETQDAPSRYTQVRYEPFLSRGSANIPDVPRLLPQERLDSVKRYLEENVIGQPEVVERLIRLEYEYFFSKKMGRDGRGLILKLMGQPGTGKDTAVETWVNGIHGRPDAYEFHLHKGDPIRDPTYDMSKYTGSAPGLIGSDSIPQFIRFLVEYSGGKYFLIEDKSIPNQTKWGVARNPDWNEGDLIPGYRSPYEGIVFLNEVHTWTPEGRNALLPFIENGNITFSPANPSTGSHTNVITGQQVQVRNWASSMRVPIIRIEASNELKDTINPDSKINTSRERESNEGIQPVLERNFSEAEVVELWKQYSHDPERLKQILIQRGTPEEYINRISSRDIFLMRPLTLEHIIDITRHNLESLQSWLEFNADYNQYRWKFSDNLISFVAEWKYHPLNGGRYVNDHIDLLIKDTLLTALIEQHLKPVGQPTEVHLDVKQSPNGVAHLEFRLPDRVFEVLIEPTSLIEPTRSSQSPQMALPF